MKKHIDSLEQGKVYYVCALVNSLVGKPLRKVEPCAATFSSREETLQNAKKPLKFKSDTYLLKTSTRTSKINWDLQLHPTDLHIFDDFEECKKYYLENLL